MRAYVEGAYVMPGFGHYEQSAELVRRVRADLADVPSARQGDET